MIKLLIEILIIIGIAFAVLYMINPVFAYQVAGAVWPLPSTITTTIPIPNATSHVYIKSSSQRLSYVISQDTAFYISGQSDTITISTANGIQVLYIDLSGSQDSLTLKNDFAVVNVSGGQNNIFFKNTSVLSCTNSGKVNKLYMSNITGNYSLNATCGDPVT